MIDMEPVLKMFQKTPCETIDEREKIEKEINNSGSADSLENVERTVDRHILLEVKDAAVEEQVS